MANRNNPNGFEVAEPEKYTPIKKLIANGITVNKGDVLYLNSSGYVQLTRVSGYVAGIAASPAINGLTGEIASTSDSSRGDYVYIYADPTLQFIGQTTTYALTDAYTTHTSATAFDVAGTTGVQYVDAGASTYDEVQVVELEPDNDGEASEVGAYAKVRCRWNLAKHAFGIAA